MMKLTLAALAATALLQGAALAGPVRVYGPGGPLPAMKEAADAFGKAHGVEITVVGGPTPSWLEKAKADGDVIFSGSETMMSDFEAALPDQLLPRTIEPLYLRPAAILVRPGNPANIGGIVDLLKPGHRILVVNGAGQNGLWEDVTGRLGSISAVKAFRTNIAKVARNSAEAKQAWMEDQTLDAWLIWTIWQKANPTLADAVSIEPQYSIFRDTGVGLTKRGSANPDATAFKTFLASPDGRRIFARWGWITDDPRP